MAKPIESLESRIAPATIIAATANNELLTFDSATPDATETISITGLAGTAGETLVGIDFRPATGALYGFTVNDASQGQLYRIDPSTGEATAIGTAITDMNLTLSKAAGYGFDFNPTVDRIRVVNSDGENFRINPNNGALAGVDSDLTAGSVVHGSAYDRNFFGSTTTTLFGIDVNTDQLVLQGSVNGTPNSPNLGAITGAGALGVNAVSASFDIQNGTGIGFAVLQVGSTTGLYTINLTSGAATSVGDIGTGTNAIVGMAVATTDLEIVNSKTAKFTEADGDIITIKITKGELTLDLFELTAQPNGGVLFRTLNLTDPSFAGTNLTITAKPGPDGGDKLTGVGYINATGNDLGNVKIGGDLTAIDAGDSAGGIGVKSLSLDSFGRIYNPTLAPDLVSTIQGSLTKLTVKKDFIHAQLVVSDPSEGLGRIDSIVIGGSLLGGFEVGTGTITAEEIGSIRIDGNMQGGPVGSTCIIQSASTIDSITIGGSFIGGDGSEGSGRIASESDIGKINIKGSIIGGNGEVNARISSGGDIGSITVGRSLIGGSDDDAGSIFASGEIGSISIKGSIIGGNGPDSASIEAGTIRKLSVGQDVIGAFSSANVFATNIGTVKIGGDLSGGGGSSARIIAENALDGISIGGSVNGAGSFSALIQGTTIGSVNIKGSLGGSDDGAGSILAETSIAKVTIGGDLFGNGAQSGNIRVSEGSIGTVSIKGSIEGGAIFGDTEIERVTVNGNASSSGTTTIGSDGALVAITVKGTLHAGHGIGSIVGDSIETLTVGGDVVNSFIGTNEDGIGSVKIQGSLQESTINTQDGDSINIGRDIVGAFEGGSILASGQIDAIVVKGSILSSINAASIITGVLGSLKVSGDVVGNIIDAVVITAVGTQATTGTTDIAIGSINVGGRVEGAQILAGYSGVSTPLNADAQIGDIKVGGDWIASNLVAGVDSEDSVFGNDDDTIIGEIGQVDSIVASIASLTIKGTVIGTVPSGPGFAFTAEEIKSAKVAGKTVSLEDGPGNDNVLLGNTQSVRIREISVV